MSAGSLAVACLADVPDWPVLGRSAKGALAMVRTPAPGELYRYQFDRLAWMDELVAESINPSAGILPLFGSIGSQIRSPCLPSSSYESAFSSSDIRRPLNHVIVTAL
jgi:hypothetical protein